MNVVELPVGTFADIPKQLRTLADQIEEQNYGDVTHLAWALDAEYRPVDVGLMGQCANPDAVAVLLFEAAKASLIRRMGK